MTATWKLGVVEVAEAIAAGAVTAEAAATAALARLESIGTRLNAVSLIERDGALAMARAVDKARKAGKALGPLAGVPMAHKDLFYRKGRRSRCGSKIMADFVPDHTATVLQRLDEAGAVELGTLQMAEFAMSPTGYNGHYGQGRTPWNIEHCSGGSSSGSGASVGARLVAGALGTDTGGSIRLPSAMCGVTGMKPTNGLVSNHGVMPLVPSLDTTGPLCRSARDVARVLSVIAGPDPNDGATITAPVRDYEAGLDGQLKGVRIAVPQGTYREHLTPEVGALQDASLVALKDAGAVIVHTTSPDMATLNAMANVVFIVEAAALHRKWLIERPQDYAEQIRKRLEPGLFLPATRYAEAMLLRGRIAQEWLAACMGDADLVHIPTMPVPVPTVAESINGTPAEIAALIGRTAHCTRAINYLGLPALAVPCGFTAPGLPASMQLVGRPYAEPLLLRVADAYQHRTDWHTRIPPLAEAA